jgi:pentatricopeptide repeat protein
VQSADAENLQPSTTSYGNDLPNTGSLRTSRPCNAELTEFRYTGPRTISTSTNSGAIYTDEDRFRRAYEDIWGTKRAMKRFPDMVSMPREVTRCVVSTKRKERVQAIVQGYGRKTRSGTGAFGRYVPIQPVQIRYGTRRRKRSYRRLLFIVRRRLQAAQISFEARERSRLLGRNRSIVRRTIPPVRTKYVRLTYGRNHRLESFSSLWSYYFTRLSRKYDRQLYEHRVPRSFRIRRVVAGAMSFARALYNASLQEVWEAWDALPLTERTILWPQIMLGALRENPEWALKFLIAASSKPYPPNSAISDSLEYIVSHYLHDVEDPDAGSVAILFRTVIGLLGNFDHYFLHLTQKTIFLLLKHISIDEAEHLYKTLVQRKHPIHENTLLQFAHAFGQNGRTQLAVDVLRRFYDNGGDFTQPKVESVCATLLQRKYRSSSDGGMSDSDIFGFLLDLGLQPNIIFYNILLQNATDSGDSGTAWQIHDMLPGLGINADANTYSILLNDAKLRMDRDAMKRIVEIVESKGIINQYIITDILHGMFLTYEQESREAYMHEPPPAPWKRMLPLYAEYFDLEPIRDLLTQAYKDFAQQSDRPKMHPPKETLVVMFIALLRGFTNPTSAPEWYRQFRTMVLNGHPDIVPLAESTHIYDAVIMCLGRWPVTLQLCTKVISDILSSYSAAQKTQKRLDLPLKKRKTLQTTMGYHPASTLLSNSTIKDLGEWNSKSRVNQALTMASEDKPAGELGKDVDAIDKDRSKGSRWGQATIYGHCKPSVRTWSILLKAFMDNNQPRAAEKVLNMMRRTGIIPNQVTWNSLAIGYARMQDIASTIDVIERFEEEGWEVNDITIKGLQVIENREALMEALQEKDRRRIKKLRAMEETRQAVEQQLDLPEPGGLNDVIARAQLAAMHDKYPRGPSRPPEESTISAHEGPRRLHLREDELGFLEKAYSTTRPQDECSEVASSADS